MVFRSLKPEEAGAFWNMINSLDYDTGVTILFTFRKLAFLILAGAEHLL